MAQALVRPENIAGDHFHLDREEAHHVVRVLRKKAGDEMVFFDGGTRRFRGRLTAVDPTGPSAKGKIIEDLRTPVSRFRLRLFQGIPSGTKMDFVIEKSVEIGVHSIFPFTSDRGQVKLDAKGAGSKADRWNRIARAAAKQCDRPDVPEVGIPAALKAWKSELEVGRTFVFSLASSAQSLKRHLRAMSEGEFRPNWDIINIVVGPESGLSPSEESLLVGMGAALVSLGSRVLRTETAGLVALAILQHELNQMERE